MKLNIPEFKLTVTFPEGLKVTSREELIKQKNYPPLMFACSALSYSILATGGNINPNMNQTQMVQANFNAIANLGEAINTVHQEINDTEQRYELVMQEHGQTIIQIYHFFDGKLVCLSVRSLNPELQITAQNYRTTEGYTQAKAILQTFARLA